MSREQGLRFAGMRKAAIAVGRRQGGQCLGNALAEVAT